MVFLQESDIIFQEIIIIKQRMRKKVYLNIKKGIMVKFKSISLLAFLFTTLIFSGCYKDSTLFEPYENNEPELPQGDIDNFFAQFPRTSNTVMVKNDTLNLIRTENGNLIELREDIFVTPDGMDASNEIEFKYIELVNPAKYAFYNLPTVSNGKLLRTEGVFYFEAYQDGNKLELREGKGIKIRMPVEEPEPGMQLFYGEEGGENFNWTLAEGPNTGTDNTLRITEWAVQLDSLQNFFTGYGYEFDVDLFVWINVDIFADIPESDKTSVCVEMDEQYTNKNTVVFMLFKDIKSIVGLPGDPDTKLFCEPYGLSPIGYEVIFFAISDQGNDEFHFGISEAKLTEDHVEYLNMEAIDLDKLIEIIEDL